MRIFDPKNQFGSSLLSSADTQKSSVKLEKQMAVGGAITLTSTDISDIENWELSNARVKVNGQMISFLPDTSRDEYGNITIDFGERFENVILVLKRVDFGGVITIEVKIQQLMAKTLIDSKKIDYDASANIAQWKALGEEAYKTDPVKYANAMRDSLVGYEITGDGEVVVDDCFLSVDTLSDSDAGGIVVADGVSGIKWHSDLPCLREAGSGDLPIEHITEWTGKIPNVTSASCMFFGCTSLTSWTVELPNSLTDATSMFGDCTGLTSFSTPSGTLPNSITTASWMFGGCTGLREFTPSLAGLTNCEWFESMFSGCILSEASIRNILGTLPDRTGETEKLSIDIGGDYTMGDSVRQQLSSLASQVSTDKNWYITLTWNTPQTQTV